MTGRAELSEEEAETWREMEWVRPGCCGWNIEFKLGARVVKHWLKGSAGSKLVTWKVLLGQRQLGKRERLNRRAFGRG